MKLLERILICLILSTGLCFGQTPVPEIIEHPQTRYALIGNEAIFYCKTKGTSAYWLIDGEAVYLRTQSSFMAQGYMFDTSTDSVYNNLTMIVPASVQTNNTEIKCRASGRGSHYPYSRTSYLVVYNTFSPNRPAVHASYHNTDNHNSHYVNVSVYAQPLWPDYTLLEVEVNITSNRNGVVFAELIIPLNGSNSYQFNQILPSSETQHCSSVSIRASVLSSNYGESEITSVELEIPRAPGNFSEGSINHTVFFYPNGTSFLSMSVQLPEGVCIYQNVNYTIIVDYEDKNSSKIVVAGPLSFNYRGPGLVHHDVFGDFDLDQEYSVFVLVDSVAGSSKSMRHTFNTFLNRSILQLPCTDPKFNIREVTESAVFHYKLALGIFVSLSTVMLFFLILIVIFVCRRKQIKSENKKRKNNVCDAMVPNPIYDGPLYESVHTQFDSLATQASCQPRNTHSPTCSSTSSEAALQDKAAVRYVPQPRSKSFVCGGPSLPSNESDAANIPRATSISEALPAIRKSGKQRNKLNLTLSLAANESITSENARDARPCDPVSAINPMALTSVDENYAIMSPAGALANKSLPKNELSPEDTDKYKE